MVENEIHFIFNCPLLSNCREPFINSLSEDKAFTQMSQESKIKYLFFNEHLSVRVLNIAADLLESLNETRDKILKLAI